MKIKFFLYFIFFCLNILNHSLAAQDVSTNCVVTESAIDDIKKSRLENEKNKKILQDKEKELKAKEDALSEQINKLEELRKSISVIQDAKKKENDEKIAKLVETVLAMSPKAAAALLSTIEDHLAGGVIAQMDTVKLGKILGLMNSEKASQLSEIMVGFKRSSLASQQTTSNISKIDKSKSEEDKNQSQVEGKGGEKDGN